MSSYPPPFVPLNAPRLPSDKPTPAEPINWFERLAPRLEPEPLDETPIVTPGGMAHRAVFDTVEKVAETERRRLNLGEPEPPEIARRRAEALSEARELVNQALQQAQVIEEEARQRGYQAGYAQGYAVGESEALHHVTQRGEEQRVALRAEVEAFILHVEAERQRIWPEFEPQIIGLVFDLAQKVVKQEIEASRKVSLSIVRNALRRVATESALRIRVNADDLETIRANREELLSLVDGIPHVEIVSDRRVGPGGCVVETSAGNIDARIETQFDDVAKTLEQLTMEPHHAQQPSDETAFVYDPALFEEEDAPSPPTPLPNLGEESNADFSLSIMGEENANDSSSSPTIEEGSNADFSLSITGEESVPGSPLPNLGEGSGAREPKPKRKRAGSQS